MRKTRTLLALGLAAGLCACAASSAAPDAARAEFTPAWTEAESAPILERTQRLHLTYNAQALTPAERAAVQELLAAGERLHQLYMDQLHPQALAAEDFLSRHPELQTERDLFRLSRGPIATTLENSRAAFLSVAPEQPSRNLYPPGMTRDIMDAFLASHPERRDELLGPRALVRDATPENVAAALAALDRHPVLDTLHPGLRARLANAERYIAIPYSVAYAEDLLFVFARLNAAADLVAPEDPAFARYLRLRARDLLADDYEAGDAAWVTGRFTGNLNAQIGAYETYDDPLYGVKTIFALSLLQRDAPRSAELAAALSEIQAVENSLPYDSHRQVRADIPVNVYNIIADFGQARSANTATILPNDAYLARQYGRTILIRGNILINPLLFANSETSFNAATIDAHHGDLRPEGNFYRTLWHEVGHYLGIDLTADGRDLDAALEDTADLLQEMKADLVSLTAAHYLNQHGAFTDERLRAVQASGILRVLQNNRPRRDQPYQTMQLIQWNWFVAHGLLRFEEGRLAIDYARYPEAVESLLREVLALQRAGDRDAANAFVERWTAWDPDLHGAIAARLRAAQRYRFALITYEALDGPAAQ